MDEELREQLEEEYDRVIKETLERLRQSKPLTRAKIAEALMKANKAYWAARLAITDNYGLLVTERVASALAVPYYYAAEELAQQVRQVFAGYQSTFNLTQREAKELIDKVVYDRSIAENLQRIADAMPESAEKTRILAEISAPAYRYRMQRAEQIAVNAKHTLENIARGEVAVDRQFLQTEIEKSYNITLEEAQRLPPSEAVVVELTEPERSPVPEMPKAAEPIQDFTPTTEHGIMDSFSVVPTGHVNEIISRDWSGQSFSERIWSNTDDLAKDVKDVLLDGVLTGKSIEKMARTIRDKYGTGMRQARRVVRTEYNYCVNQAQLKALMDEGNDEYEFMSVGEGEDGACDMCGDLDGMRFKIADAVVGINCPPMHPNCRCNVVTPRETDEKVQAEIDRLLDGRSIEDIERELDRQIAEKEEAERLLSAAMSGENSQNALTITTNSGIIETKAGTVVERPDNEPDYLKQYDRYDVSSRTDEEKLAQVNPHYGEGDEWNCNCQRCVAAYEAVERGYDVTAKPYSDDKVGRNGTLLWKFNGGHWTQDNDVFFPNEQSDFKTEIGKSFVAWGDGSRAAVRVEGINGVQHSFIAKFENSVIKYFDPLINSAVDIDKVVSESKTVKYSRWFMRIDNREFSDMITYAIENRRQK